MRLAMVGLGRMGANMTRRLLRSGHEVVVHDIAPEAAELLAGEGAEGAADLDALRGLLPAPRVVWVMVPAGGATDAVVTSLEGILEDGDIVVDGGNAHFRDSQRRAEALAGRGIAFLDAGTSGGVWGLEEGYCLMVGGADDAFATVEPVLRTLAPEDGYAHVGPSGAGHFVKMVHNGIEYGILQAYAEGFELLHAAPELGIEPDRIAGLWRHGSVVRSWLLDLLHQALEADPALEAIRGYVDDSGEGRWTVEEAVRRGVPATVMSHALFARFTSRQDDSYAMRVIAALREGFGGHATEPSDG